MTRKIIFLLLLLLVVMPLFSLKTEEKVKVDWWVLPLFAVDKQDKALDSLKKEDLELFISGQKIDNFILYNRDFDVSRATAQQVKTSPIPIFDRGKMVFLIFDRVLTSTGSLRRAKATAKELVQKASPEIQFVLLTIEPGQGLHFMAGPWSNKKNILEGISKIKERANRRRFLDQELFNQEDTNTGRPGITKYGKGNIEAFKRIAYKLLKMEKIPFFESFQTFYFNVNSIKKNKFIYLFTEGVSRAQIGEEKGQTYYDYMDRIASYLGRCGAVLFILNPTHSQEGMLSSGVDSGVESLKYLAKASGGKYIHSHKQKAGEIMANFHRSYFEIAFPDPGNLKGKVHEISIKPKNREIRFHTPATIEKQRAYRDLSPLEQELLVLNLVSENPLYYTPIQVWAAPLLNEKISRDIITITIKVPDSFKNKPLDLYKIVPGGQEGNAKIERTTTRTTKNKLKIQYKIPGKSNINFVLLEPESSTALVEGPGFYAELPRKKKQVKALSDDPGYQEELKRHLAGAATYCDRLRGEAFHFFCKEKIKEVKGTIESNQQRAKGKYNSQFLTQLDIKKILKPQERTGKQFQTYIFDYQLISNNKQVKEQRKPLSGSKGEESIQKISGLISSFLTQKAAFGPLTLLARERQALLRFRLLRFDNFKGKRCAVIEAIPKKPRDIHFAYGLVWVDSRDFSIPRIELDPNSIQGYGQLLRLAKKLRARLFLQCTITYNNIRKGLRFPTQITIKETYQGSNSMYNALGTRNWERNKTQISYYDYRFFDVDATVVAER